MAAFNGKNVLFLQGSQVDLNKMMSNSTDATKKGTAKEGAFYLTNDTHRLYIGRTLADGNTYPVPVNEGVVTVNTLDDLTKISANAGEFYYVSGINVLCVYAGEGVGFVQINSDTDTDSFISAINNYNVSSDASGIKVSFDIVQKAFNKDGKDITTTKATAKDENGDLQGFAAKQTVEFTIAKSHLDTVLPDNIAVGLDATAIADGSGVKLSTTGTGADTANIVNLKEGNGNVTIEVSGDDITISTQDDDTKYDLVGIENTTKGQIQLKAKDGSENDDVYFESGNDALTVASTASGVTYTHKAYTTTEGENTPKSVAHKGKFTVVDSITTDKGHVTAWTSKEIELPEDHNTTNASMAINVGANEAGTNAKGSLIVSITDSNNGTVDARADDVLYHKITIDGTEQTIYNQQSLGSFYSAGKVDTLMRGVNAMTYKGTVGHPTKTEKDENGEDIVTERAPLPSINDGVAIGDTYMVAHPGTYAGIECDTGDLLIATGTEDNNGVIINTITWTYVPAGNDTDTHYDISVASITDSTNQTIDGAQIVLGNDVNTDKDSVQILGGTAIDVTPGTDTITISHENITRATEGITDTDAPAHGGTFTAVKSVESNAQGHVTKVVTTTVTLPADENTLYSLSGSEDKIILSNSNSNEVDEITVTDDGTYIAATVASNTLNIAHKTYTEATLSATAAGTAKEVAHGASFTALTGVTRDSGGHITGVTSETWQLPADENTTYSMSDHVVTSTATQDALKNVTESTATITTTLSGTDSSTDTATFNVTSTSLTIEAAADKSGFAVNMVWGSF